MKPSKRSSTTFKKTIKGLEFAFDEADRDEVESYTWSVDRRRGGRTYLWRNASRNGVFIKVYLHRVLAKAGPDDVVDHLSMDTRDNRKSNLRLCTRSQNQQNHGARGRNKTGFKGVFKASNNDSNPWRSQIRANGVVHWLGYFPTKKAAALAYDKAAKRLHGKFANLNFPKLSTLQ